MIPEWKRRALADPDLPEKSLATPETWSEQSGRSFHSPSNKMEIPNPWD